MSEHPRLVEVRRNVLKQNDVVAHALRARFRAAGVYAVSLVSSPGAGKTAFLEKVLGRLGARYGVAALVGDLATDNDARRLARSGAARSKADYHRHGLSSRKPQMVQDALADWDLGVLDFLFIENVGNLVCPSSFDLGEDLRLVLFSVTEGEDKPLKYPTIFNTADVALITKIDLAAAVEFDAAAAQRSIQSVRPGMQVFEVSAKTGVGMEPWLHFLLQAKGLPAGRWTERLPSPLGGEGLGVRGNSASNPSPPRARGAIPKPASDSGLARLPDRVQYSLWNVSTNTWPTPASARGATAKN